MTKKEDVKKSFPADPSLEKDEKGKLKLTFLNDSAVDGELYAYLLSISYGDKKLKQTIVYKKSMPPITKLAKTFNSSRQTIYNHLKYLKDNNYIEDTPEYYIIHTHKEAQHFSMPLELVEYFVNTMKQPVIKLYIYLGQRWSWKGKEYSFTINELCSHLGLNPTYSNNRKKIRDYLECLSSNNLIEVESFFEGKIPRMRLTSFKIERPNTLEKIV